MLGFVVCGFGCFMLGGCVGFVVAAMCASAKRADQELGL